MKRSTHTLGILLASLGVLLVLGGAAPFVGGQSTAPVPGHAFATAQEETPDGPTQEGTSVDTAQEETPDGTQEGSTDVSEQRYVEEAPEEGDEYYEAEGEDGSWISYVNPRDRYRDPMIGNASGKVCVTLRNEAGEVIVGESLPNTTVTVPTPTLSWHSHADPMVVELPLTDNYDRPLDADQFGTSPNLPQGDGYMDSHCIEYHGPPDNATIEYGEAQIDGEFADRVDVVGYIEQARTTWDSDVDPIEDSVPYEETGGGWTMREGASHGQVTIVLQLRSAREASTGGSKDAQVESTVTPGETETAPRDSEQTATEGGSADPIDQLAPGFGTTVVAAVIAVALAARSRRT